MLRVASGLLLDEAMRDTQPEIDPEEFASSPYLDAQEEDETPDIHERPTFVP